MLHVNGKNFNYLFITAVLCLALVLYGCGGSSGSPASDECVISGVVVPDEELTSLLSSRGSIFRNCEVWSGNDFNKRVTADSSGNYHLISIPGTIRTAARLRTPEGVFVGRSILTNVLKGYKENVIEPFMLNKGVKQVAFKVKDSSGNILRPESGLKASVWGIPASFDTNRNIYYSSLMPDRGISETMLWGPSFMSCSLESELKNIPDLFEYTVLRNSDRGHAPVVVSMCSTNGSPADSDFIQNGIHDLDLTAEFEDKDGDIATWTWNDGGLGQFLYQGGDSSFTYSRAIWRPNNAESVGTITFRVCDRNNYWAGAAISINKGGVSNILPGKNGIKISFSGLNENNEGEMYNPTIVPLNTKENSFKVKINIGGIGSPLNLKGGSVKTAVTFDGFLLADNGDETPDNILNERVYTLLKPEKPGFYTVKVSLEDSNGKFYSSSYEISFTDDLIVSSIEFLPNRTVFKKEEKIAFKLEAETKSLGEELTFIWYIDGIEQFRDISAAESAKKESIYETENLNYGKHNVKCVVNTKSGLSFDRESVFKISKGILMEFMNDTNDPPCFNQTWFDCYESVGAPEFKVMIYNRNKENLKIRWNLKNKSSDGDWKEIICKTAGENLGNGCVLSAKFTDYFYMDPATYSLEVNVEDENQISNSLFLEDIYFDHRPNIIKSELISNKYFTSLPYDYDYNSDLLYYKFQFPDEEQGITANLIINDNDIQDSISVKWYVDLYDSFYDWQDDLFFDSFSGYRTFYSESKIDKRTEVNSDASCFIPYDIYKEQTSRMVITYEIIDVLYGKPEHKTKGYILVDLSM